LVEVADSGAEVEAAGEQAMIEDAKRRERSESFAMGDPVYL
jgi:hypothetical protein